MGVRREQASLRPTGGRDTIIVPCGVRWVWASEHAFVLSARAGPPRTPAQQYLVHLETLQDGDAEDVRLYQRALQTQFGMDLPEQPTSSPRTTL